MIRLSILVCSVHTRYDSFLPKIQRQLYGQMASLSEDDQKLVEILILTDNKQMMLGEKRNKMVDLAQGKYVVFVDDDDRVVDDYIKQLLDATTSNADVITFQAEVSLNGGTPKICYYSKDNEKDYNTDDAYYRIPNHIACVRRDVSLKSSFPNVLYGEDSGYSKVLLKHLRTEHKIDKVLYYYDYNSTTSETQSWRRSTSKQRNQKPLVDVIILSKARNRREMAMTQKTIDSCYLASNALPINIIVLEGGAGNYRNARTISKPERFNYNQFANFGALQGSAEWIMIANNDLVFHDGWLHYLLSANHPIVSPHEPNDPRQQNVETNEPGYTNGRHLSGWCFMIKRSLWEGIGHFDDSVDFWCSDDVVIEQLSRLGIAPMLVKDSIVEHLGSKTLTALESEAQQDLKWRNVYIFNKKYGRDKFKDSPAYNQYLRNNQQKLEALEI